MWLPKFLVKYRLRGKKQRNDQKNTRIIYSYLQADILRKKGSKSAKKARNCQEFLDSSRIFSKKLCYNDQRAHCTTVRKGVRFLSTLTHNILHIALKPRRSDYARGLSVFKRTNPSSTVVSAKNDGWWGELYSTRNYVTPSDKGYTHNIAICCICQNDMRFKYKTTATPHWM